jgi:ABC-type transport system involved in multi-copper enzyme maturation permease subunit
MPTFELLSAEILKMRKRWLPYLLFLVMVAGVAMLIWLGGYAEFRSSSDFDSDDLGLHTMALPWSLVALIDSGQFWGAFLVGVLIGSGVATEYNWGTVRQALIRGQTRSEYLTLKLLGLASVSATILLSALAVGLLFSVVATVVAGEPVTFDAPGGPSALEAVLIVVRGGYGILPYALLAFCLTVVSRSTAMGVAGILVFLIGEAILSAILGGLGGPAPTIRSFLIGHNVSALLAANAIDGSQYNSMAFRDLPVSSDVPDLGAATLVIAAYCALFVAIAYSVFHRRDLGVESGAS